MSKRSLRRARTFPVRLRESALEKVALREAPRGSVAGVTEAGNGRLLVQLISEGWGSSGHYTADVLERAAKKKVFAKGVSMYIDHQKPSDRDEQPERSVHDLAARLVTDAWYDPSRKALVAEAKALPTYRHLLLDEDFYEAVGLSICAGGLAEYGQVGDRKGLIVKEITEAESVDFVTKAGRGGKVLALLESARRDVDVTLTETGETEQVVEAPAAAESVDHSATETPLREARNIGAWLESRLHLDLTMLADDMYGDGRLTRDERIALSKAIGLGLQAYTAEIEASAPQLFQRDLYERPEDVRVSESARLREATSDQIRTALMSAVRAAHSTEHTWCWIRDYDADRGLVWFDVESPDDGCATYQQAYTTSGADAAITAALTGERVAVVAQTVYVPAAAPAADLPLYESAEPDDTAEQAPTTTDVTDGAPPTGSTTPINTEEVSAVADTSTAGTAPVVDTAAIQFEAREAAVARDKAVGERDAALKEAADIRAERDAARAELARFRAVESARPLVAAQLAEAGLPAAAQAKVTAGVTSRVPLTEAGLLDQHALRTLVDAEVTAEKTYLAQLAEANGAGAVTGFGQQVQPVVQATSSWAAPADAPNAALVEAYRSRGLDAKAAEAAARGRQV